MAAILPIKGVRYNTETGYQYSELITPPYDIISAQEQEHLYQKHPYNIIRLEYGKSLPGDDELNNRYTRAAHTFKQWLEQKILVQEKEEAVYLYEQRFIYNHKSYMRQALFCGVKVTPFSEGEIIPHEETLDKPLADRLKLLKHCEANFSPVFGLFKDPDRFVERQSKNFKQTDPVLSFTDGEGQSHKLWAVLDKGFIASLQEFFSSSRIFIADGHHRYGTSLQFYEEKKKDPGFAHNYGHTLMALVNLHDDGLLTFPTHRLVTSNELSAESLLQALATSFAITEKQAPRDKEQLDRLLYQLRSDLQQKKFSLGLYTGEQRFFMLADENRPFPWLDTVVLQELVFTGIFGWSKEHIRNKASLRYTQDGREAMQAVDRGEARFAFFLNEPLLEEIVGLAEKGLRLPQKSTFFYPKFVTGLVINKLSV